MYTSIWLSVERVMENNGNKRPMGIDALLKNQLGHGQGSKSCTYTLFLAPAPPGGGGEI